MYTENYSPEEAERIKKIIEISESQKQIKQSFWNEINTPDVLKLKEESNVLWEDYWSVDEELRNEVLIHNNGLSISDHDYISLSVSRCGAINPKLNKFSVC